MTVNVCDMIMGSGKTSAAITRMNEDKEGKYIFITPFLLETDRIRNKCSDRNFISPANKGDGKLESLHYLLSNGHNIASTHALFKQYSDYTLELIKEGHYKLILDEVCDVIEHIDIHKDDIDLLERQEVIAVVDNIVYWISDSYDGDFRWLKHLAKNNDVIIYDDYMMLWIFPAKVFEAFDEVTILTYKFDSQIQRCYYDMCGISCNYIGLDYLGKDEKGEDVYKFSDNTKNPDYAKKIINHVNILEDENLNYIGEKDYSLSASWFLRESRKRDKTSIKKLKNNLLNVFTNRFKTLIAFNMWTTYKDYKDDLAGKGYTNGFLAYNARATNNYADKTHLAYCANVYFNPFLKNFFSDRNIMVNEDDYALSEMIQWIWRATIRNGNDIWIYIPSKRMRNLLKSWLLELGITK